MVITQAQLLRAVPNLYKPRLSEFVASFNMNAVFFGLNKPQRAIHFLAQVFTETQALKSTSENLNYSVQRLMQVWPNRFKTKEFAQQYANNPEKLANFVYANRMGNGPESSGDGWKYRGRGFICLTGKEQYSNFNKYCMCIVDVLAEPNKVADFPLNQISAMYFWEKYKLNDIADLDDGGKIGESLVDRITKIINGGLNGIADRKFYYRRFKKELCI